MSESDYCICKRTDTLQCRLQRSVIIIIVIDFFRNYNGAVCVSLKLLYCGLLRPIVSVEVVENRNKVLENNFTHDL